MTTAIYGCAGTSNGNVQPLGVVSVPSDCKDPNTLVTWDQTGPAGAAGPAGVTGPAGPAGLTGPVGRLSGAEVTRLISACAGIGAQAASIHRQVLSAQRALTVVFDAEQKYFARHFALTGSLRNKVTAALGAKAAGLLFSAVTPASPSYSSNSSQDANKKPLDPQSMVGELDSLRLQMAMDRFSKFMTTLSNIEKKASAVASRGATCSEC